MRFIYIIRSAVTFVGLNKPAQVSSRKVDSLVLESSDRKWIPQKADPHSHQAQSHLVNEL